MTIERGNRAFSALGSRVIDRVNIFFKPSPSEAANLLFKLLLLLNCITVRGLLYFEEGRAVSPLHLRKK